MSIKDRVYDFLSMQISSGNMKRNDKITEQYLAEQLGISRTPVREVLFQLSADDILEHEPRKGFKFKQYTKEDVQDYYEMIGVLDAKIASLVVNNLKESDYSLMKFYIDAMSSAIENKLYTKYNDLQITFHNIYINKCENEKMIAEIHRLKKKFIGADYSRIDEKMITTELLKTNTEHMEILKLFKEGRANEVRDYIENVHWSREKALLDNW
ncbi:GntR family transcriptional regulator [Anaerosphaera multitolerans]|nr:GntR family transcriptional regulator [Anaerosphaera multitolerans]